ncbi:unnamed protein product [Nezara viridula]|uniref:Neither inactivation nor afterpotential protein C n=1 Tax=Nezara viridula TaxID=85310 RepID=A0A9P0E3M2_NEZVI|nr:unnamed protein product [Nezara viridula]
MERGLGNEGLDLDKLEDPGEKYELQEILGAGVNAKVYAATDKNSGHKVAIKVQKVTNENKSSVEEEYKILRDLSSHPNLPDFYGVYKHSEGNKNYVWFVMELCEGGPVIDLIRALHRQAKKMNELHIAFILKETIKAIQKLHENHVIHRDIKGSNILLTKNGEVKLVDFGISKELSSTLGRCLTSIGSPSWMAPEVVECKGNKTAYDNRADVWALGITAIELGDGKAPFQDMHPTSALFQIVRNPPPTLYRPANWTQNYNDFIAECLEKNPEHRPYLMEIMEHPFITQLPENDFHLNAELKSLLENVTSEDLANRSTEISIRKGYLKKGPSLDEEPMCVADMAALEKITEDNIIEQLEARYRKNDTYTFIGDVLLFLNPNKLLDIYGYQFYSKYKFKSRSDNEPHIFSIADSAYQNMLHHNTPQHIVISGEIMSGKTQQFKHIINHLLFLGWNGKQISDKIKKAVEVIQAFGNAATPLHDNSTRHALYTQITFSNSGKISGAIFWLYQLEKWRVTGNRSPYHANFHIFYYLYDGLSSEGNLETYMLEREKSYCYFRREISEEDVDHKAPLGPRDRPETNAACFRKLKESLTALQFEESEQDLIWKILAAIILLGEIEYKEDEDGNADIKDVDVVDKVASLLEIDGKRLTWALCNYCVIEKDTAARRKHSISEAIAARNVLAQTLYARVVDWIINLINYKMSLLRAVYGDHHFIGILDIFGFECYDENGLEQLFVNALNEQLQYYYNQKIFISEIEEEEEEEIQLKKFQFYNNRDTMDELFNKPNGLMRILDEANKLNMDSEYIIDALDKKSEGSRILSCGEEEFFVAHYTGKVRYQTTTMCTKNRDFLPPELTEILRCSANNNIKQLFTNKLNRTGNLTINTSNIITSMGVVKKKSWGSALLADPNRTARPYNTASKGEFSQTRGIRTAAAIFKSTSLEILKSLASGSSYFVRCIRTDLQGTPGGFQQGIIRQQLRALSVIDTAKARQLGYSHRITFAECLDRYQFLAFDFDEEVEKTRDNCRLLMIRLKLEGWYLGNSKVFLKYYNEEYLSRMYETQVKKIVKVQSMLRAFLAKRNVANKKLKSTPSITESGNDVIQEE